MTQSSTPVVILDIEPDGPLLGSEADALDLIGRTYGTDTQLIAIPVERLDPGFFRLSTGIAGAFTQKFLNYRFRVAFIGDIAEHLAGSSALRDYVYESNSGNHVLFLPDRSALAARF